MLDFLRNSVDELGQAIVMVTHDPSAASYAHRVVFLDDGRLVGEILEPTAESVLDALRELGVGRRDRADLVGAATGEFAVGGPR